jgi:hypothetical protein
MDQGVPATFKASYLRKTFAKLIQATDDENKPTVEFLKSFKLKHAVGIIVEASAEMSQSCMNGAWENLLPHFVHDF